MSKRFCRHIGTPFSQRLAEAWIVSIDAQMVFPVGVAETTPCASVFSGPGKPGPNGGGRLAHSFTFAVIKSYNRYSGKRYLAGHEFCIDLVFIEGIEHWLPARPEVPIHPPSPGRPQGILVGIHRHPYQPMTQLVYRNGSPDRRSRSTAVRCVLRAVEL